MVINEKFRSPVTDTRTHSDADIGSDHCTVVMNFCMRMKLMRNAHEFKIDINFKGITIKIKVQITL